MGAVDPWYDPCTVSWGTDLGIGMGVAYPSLTLVPGPQPLARPLPSKSAHSSSDWHGPCRPTSLGASTPKS